MEEDNHSPDLVAQAWKYMLKQEEFNFKASLVNLMTLSDKRKTKRLEVGLSGRALA